MRSRDQGKKEKEKEKKSREGVATARSFANIARCVMHTAYHHFLIGCHPDAIRVRFGAHSDRPHLDKTPSQA